jgi:hypothetical protein
MPAYTESSRLHVDRTGAGRRTAEGDVVIEPPSDAYTLLRRELVRAQARLKRAERERDAARADAAGLRALLRAHGIAEPDAG